MSMGMKPRKVIDPRTGKERVVSVEEQITLLEKGILFDAQIIPEKEDSQDFSPGNENRS